MSQPEASFAAIASSQVGAVCALKHHDPTGMHAALREIELPLQHTQYLIVYSSFTPQPDQCLPFYLQGRQNRIIPARPIYQSLRLLLPFCWQRIQFFVDSW